MHGRCIRFNIIMLCSNVDVGWSQPAIFNNDEMQVIKSLGIVGGTLLFGWTLMKTTTPSREDFIKVYLYSIISLSI